MGRARRRRQGHRRRRGRRGHRRRGGPGGGGDPHRDRARLRQADAARRVPAAGPRRARGSSTSRPAGATGSWSGCPGARGRRHPARHHQGQDDPVPRRGRVLPGPQHQGRADHRPRGRRPGRSAWRASRASGAPVLDPARACGSARRRSRPGSAPRGGSVSFGRVPTRWTGAAARSSRPADDLKARRNRASEAIGQAKRRGEDAAPAIEESRRGRRADQDARRRAPVGRGRARGAARSRFPNLPHPSVPVGATAEDNVEVRRWGAPRAVRLRAQAPLGARRGARDPRLRARGRGSPRRASRCCGARRRGSSARSPSSCSTSTRASTATPRCGCRTW